MAGQHSMATDFESLAVCLKHLSQQTSLPHAATEGYLYSSRSGI